MKGHLSSERTDPAAASAAACAALGYLWARAWLSSRSIWQKRARKPRIFIFSPSANGRGRLKSPAEPWRRPNLARPGGRCHRASPLTSSPDWPLSKLRDECSVQMKPDTGPLIQPWHLTEALISAQPLIWRRFRTPDYRRAQGACFTLNALVFSSNRDWNK